MCSPIFQKELGTKMKKAIILTLLLTIFSTSALALDQNKVGNEARNKIKKGVVLKVLLSVFSKPDLAFGQNELDAAFNHPDAPLADNVKGVSQKGNNILILDYESSPAQIKSFDGDNWKILDIELDGDEKGLAVVQCGVGNLIPGDLVTASGKNGTLTVYRQDRFGTYNKTRLSLSIDPDMKIDGLSFNMTAMEIVSDNMIYDAEIIDSTIYMGTKGKPVESDDDVVGYTRISQNRTGELTNDTYSQINTRKNEKVITTVYLQIGQEIDPEVIPIGGYCDPELIISGEQICHEGYSCKSVDDISNPELFSCQLDLH